MRCQLRNDLVLKDLKQVAQSAIHCDWSAPSRAYSYSCQQISIGRKEESHQKIS